jgi:HK97 gp10 family phage protein
MARSINALSRGELQKGLALVTKDVERVTRDISGADSDAVKAAATVLLKEVKRLIGTKGGGKPSAPGQPPARQSGRYFKSWRQAVVQGARRVGTADFRSWMQEYGTDKAAPRPHARPALENVAGQMGEVIVSESQKAMETVDI